MRQRIAIVQRDILWQDVDANLCAIEPMLDGVEADVVVLSEMFQTGFVTEPRKVADDGRTLCWMQGVAKRYDCAVVGSVVVEEAGCYYNRLYFVKPTGEVEYYNKHHLFSVGGEDRHFTAGDRRVVVEWRGVRYLLEICYDLRFQAWVVGVNRVGREPELEYVGDSMVVDHLGRIVADAEDRECVEVVAFDSEDIARFRTRFNVGRDADSFEIL